MKQTSYSVEIGELLSHADWIRQVAGRLVNGAGGVEDAVQDAWVEALERPPKRARNLRGWLATVALNRVRQMGRSEKRRAWRERSAARPEAQPSAIELAERAAVQRELVGHVLALDEPFRAVVLMRFFDGLTPPEISERLGVPLKTVHSRMQRAFERLRVRLDHEYGDSKRWGVVFVPLLVAREVAPVAAGTAANATVGMGGLGIVKVNLVLTVGLCAVGGMVWWATRAQPEAEPGVGPRVSTSAVSVGASEFPLEKAEPRLELVETSTNLEDSATSPLDEIGASAETHRYWVAGRVVDLSGNPLLGVSVAVGDPGRGRPEHDGRRATAETDASGLFRLLIDEGTEGEESTGLQTYALWVVDSEWTTVRQGCVNRTNREMEQLVVAAPMQQLEGRVEDRDGVPIAEASIRLSSQGDAFFRFPFPLDLTKPVTREIRSDALGQFVAKRFPRTAGLQLYVFANGYVATSVELDAASSPLVIQLTKTEEAAEQILEGTVVDERGFPVGGARVRLASSKASTDASGLFRLPLTRFHATTPLCAGKTGLLPAVIDNFGALIEQQGERLQPVELMLGPEPVEIGGRVVDQNGDACAGWQVSVLDTTALTQFRIPFDTAEGLALGAEPAGETDAQGRFVVPGLFPRDYLVQAYERSSLLRGEAVLTGGTRDAVLQVDRSFLGSVEGQVVDGRGAPVAGVQIGVELDVVKVPWGSSSISGQRVVTGDDGRFAFSAIPLRYVHLSYTGEQILPGRFEPQVRASAEPWVVSVRRRCHFRIELAGTLASASWATLYDTDGRSLQVNKFQANGMSAHSRAPLREGQSEVLSVSESATTIVFFEGERELGRRTFTLEPGKINLLQF